MASDYDDMTTAEQSPGSQLKALREAAGFSLTYVAEQMRLSETYISYLEQDDFNKLPTEPFVIGYYRAYARILNVAPEGLIESYRADRQQHTDSAEFASDHEGHERDYSSKAYKPLKPGEQGGKTKKSDNRLYAIISLLLVVTWIVVSLLSENEGQPEVSEAVENAQTEQLPPRDADQTSESPAVVTDVELSLAVADDSSSPIESDDSDPESQSSQVIGTAETEIADSKTAQINSEAVERV
uniref:helix-turn-helix domain-containing protein n=1 Tax=Pseudomaricurvus sp. TaxID=2004510 RepID=UPI003F6C974B